MNVNSLFIASIRTRSQSFNHQIVRWRKPGKKPFWLGIAKSKMFYIKPPKIEIPEEKEADTFMTLGYETAMNSLMNFIKHDNPHLEEIQTEGGVGAGEFRLNLEKSIEESLKNNDSWNSECARLRDIRMKEKMEKELEKSIKEIDAWKEQRAEANRLIEEIVRKEKDLSQFYITPENLDEAIEKCLNNVDCYDFAIDLQGNLYHGRESLPAEPKLDIDQMAKECFS